MEIKKWFKTLEENRYKKTYASDARRVSWLVNNNLSEDYEAMPISMKKKWPKAAYKRERFLAKEFVKHLQNEAKLRESIRRIIKEEIQKLNEGSDWILLKSVNKMIDQYTLNFMEVGNELGGKTIKFNKGQPGRDWTSLYKKLSSKDKRTVNNLQADLWLGK